MSHSSGGWKVQVQSAGGLSVCRAPAFWLLFGCLLAVSSHAEGVRGLSGTSFTETLLPFRWAWASWTHHLQKTPPPNVHTGAYRFQHKNSARVLRFHSLLPLARTAPRARQPSDSSTAAHVRRYGNNQTLGLPTSFLPGSLGDVFLLCLEETQRTTLPEEDMAVTTQESWQQLPWQRTERSDRQTGSYCLERKASFRHQNHISRYSILHILFINWILF